MWIGLCILAALKINEFEGMRGWKAAPVVLTSDYLTNVKAVTVNFSLNLDFCREFVKLYATFDAC